LTPFQQETRWKLKNPGISAALAVSITIPAWAHELKAADVHPTRCPNAAAAEIVGRNWTSC